MGTKTISLSDEAYERLKASKKAGESFSDTVNRIAPGVQLDDYWGILDEEVAAELREVIDERRADRADDRERRRERIVSELSGSDESDQ